MTDDVHPVTKWRRKTKDIIIKSFGGKCCICGYDRCNRALELHHLNPSLKEITISYLMIHPRSRKLFIEELRKCILLCSNCHTEVHDDLVILDIDKNYFNEEKYIELINKKPNKKDQPESFCPICGKIKKSYNLTCSMQCSKIKSSKVDWSKYDLIEMVEKESLSYSKIGRIIGISGTAVRKRYLKLKKI